MNNIVRLLSKPQLTYREVNNLSHLTYNVLPMMIANARRKGQRELANALSKITHRVESRFRRMSGPPMNFYNSNNNQPPQNYRNEISRQTGRNANYNNFMKNLKRVLAGHRAAKHWRETMPYEVRQGRVNVKLPANASDIVSYKNFKKGNEAIMVIKKRILNGQVRPKRYYIEKNTFARLAGIPWAKAMRKKSSDFMFKDPLNRRNVYRRNLMNVKFV